MTRKQQQYSALGSQIYVTLVTEQDKIIESLFTAIHNKIDTFEARFSRFLPDSELTYFNTHAGQKVKVSDEFLQLLRASKAISIDTEGLYNPFILPALQRVGYLRSWPDPDNAKKVVNDFTERSITTIDHLDLNEDWAKIPSNTALDFGGIGKGYLLDELDTFLQPYNLDGYWLSLGGDIICSGVDVTGYPWEVGVQGVLDTNRTVETIVMPQQNIRAVATSGVTKRQGVKDGKSWHHIIDPSTGASAETQILSATVTADTAVKADVYAKCIIIGGISRARYFKSKGRIASFFIQPATSEYSKVGR